MSFFRRTWSRYDVGVSRDDRLVALFELSVHDTNVAHALHNGELKLLGRSDGVGITSGSDFAAERGLTPDDVVNVRRRLAAVPVRGIFYIGAGSRGVLDKTTKAAWHETKAKGFQGETEFRSAILHPARTVTLRDLLSRLSEQGLYCWFYSLSGEASVETIPPQISNARGF